MLLFLYILLYVSAVIADSKSIGVKEKYLSFLCIIFSFIAGGRSINVWPDTIVYDASFRGGPDVFSFSWDYPILGYEEHGFAFLGAVVRTFTSSSILYFTIIAGLSLWVLYKDIRKYCIYPILGFCVYVARFFMGRNMIQIRAGLSYVIIVWAIQYITRKDWKKYFLFVGIAYLFHHSSIIALPLYFLCCFKIGRIQIVCFQILAFVLTIFFTPVLQHYVTDNASDLNISTKYVTGDEIEKAKGISNPMIYFQTFILMLYTFSEKKLKKLSCHYFTIRTAYAYSTFILTTFSMFLALGSRTSTMFATLEFVVIPSLINVVKRKNRKFVYFSIGIILTIIFYMNLPKNN